MDSVAVHGLGLMYSQHCTPGSALPYYSIVWEIQTAGVWPRGGLPSKWMGTFGVRRVSMGDGALGIITRPLPSQRCYVSEQSQRCRAPEFVDEEDPSFELSSF